MRAHGLRSTRATAACAVALRVGRDVGVLAPVLKHINEGISHFAWGFEGMVVPAIRLHGAATEQELVEALGDADGEAAYTAG